MKYRLLYHVSQEFRKNFYLFVPGKIFIDLNTKISDGFSGVNPLSANITKWLFSDIGA